MDTRLSVREKDVLERIVEKPELRPFFFRKVKGVKWFESLDRRGFFNPDQNPRPVPSKSPGYITVPAWLAIDYLSNTAQEFSAPENREYAKRTLQIIREATDFCKAAGYGNYRTWWKFGGIIRCLPSDIITDVDVDAVDYWLDDRFDRGVLVDELAEWVSNLLSAKDATSHSIALKILRVLYRVVFIEDGSGKGEAALRFDAWHGERLTKKVAAESGRILGADAVSVFKESLEVALSQREGDQWSSVWRPAIEDHEQNRHSDSTRDVLVNALRDCLESAVTFHRNVVERDLVEILNSDYQTLRRIGVHATNVCFPSARTCLKEILRKDFFHSNVRHEMWRLLKDRYQEFSESEKEKVWQIISLHEEYDEENEVRQAATAYWRAIWLSALRDKDERLRKAYEENVALAGSEPSHPDFSSFTWSGGVIHESPIKTEELLSLSAGDLVTRLNSYKGSEKWGEPGIEGLAKAVRGLIKERPLAYSAQLSELVHCKIPFLYEIIEGYRELWEAKADLPWKEIWPDLLQFFESIINGEEFWSAENETSEARMIANRFWVVSSISRLIELGCKSDEHAFQPEMSPRAEIIIRGILEREKGEEFSLESDAVTVAINSPRGQAIEALVNLSLRACRLADRKVKNHSKAWEHFEGIYDAELKRSKMGEYEFATLVANYLPNFFYMSKDWTIRNLPEIFDQNDYLKWVCALQGYTYVNVVYPEIYRYLKSSGTFIRALSDQVVRERTRERIIQNVIIAYFAGDEELSDETGLLRKILDRRVREELGQIIWFVWTLRDGEDQELTLKVLILWESMMKVLDLNTVEGRELASKLCTWIVFIQELDDRSKGIILPISQYAEFSYHASDVLEELSRISKKQPIEASEVWDRMLSGGAPDFPEEAIVEILSNLVKCGAEGERKARSIIDRYIRAGNESGIKWLRKARERVISGAGAR